jgi:hypothetical protein
MKPACRQAGMRDEGLKLRKHDEGGGLEVVEESWKR